MQPRQDLAAAASMAVAAAIWGGTFVVSKVVLEVVPPLALVALRFAMAWALLRLLLRALGRPPVPWRDAWVPALIGLIGMPLAIGSQFVGTALTSAGDGALVTSSAPALMAVFAAFLLREPLKPLHVVAITLSTAGVLLVTGIGTGDWHPIGHTALALSAASWALYTVLTRWASRRLDPLAVLAGACGWGALVSLPFVSLDWPWARLADPTIGGGVLFITLGSTLLAFALWSWGCARLPARVGGLFLFVQPLVATVLAALLLGERPAVSFYLGGALILLGVALAQQADRALSLAVAAE